MTGPDPASRRAKGKDDTLDAIAATEAARTRRRVQVAKDRSGAVEALRVLRTTRMTEFHHRATGRNNGAPLKQEESSFGSIRHEIPPSAR